jgi:hypothetical protein
MTSACLPLLVVLAGLAAAPARADEPTRPFRAQQVFDLTQPIIFQDDFQSGRFGRWNFSEDDRYGLLKETPERMRIVDAPGLAGSRAACFTVPRAPNSFRAEVSLPHERGFQERWYGARLLIPVDWIPDPNRAADIVMQWHAIPGNWRATYPNLAISVQQTNWVIAQSFGCAQTNPTRRSVRIDEPLKPGAWVSWVLHAKWAPDTNGLIQIWKDGRLVLERAGTNVYSTIGIAYTPYLKTGLYRPEWHTDTAEKRARFDRETPAATNKVVYVADVKVGDARARYDDVAPRVPALHGNE